MLDQVKMRAEIIPTALGWWSVSEDLPFICWGTLERSLGLSAPQFPHLSNGEYVCPVGLED